MNPRCQQSGHDLQPREGGTVGQRQCANCDHVELVTPTDDEMVDALARIWAVGYTLDSLRALAQHDHYHAGADYRVRRARRKAVAKRIEELEQGATDATR